MKHTILSPGGVITSCPPNRSIARHEQGGESPPGNKKISGQAGQQRFRRFKGYDYSRGAAVFITFHLEPRKPLFGRISGGKVQYSPAGEIARRVIMKERIRTPLVQLKRHVIMPDHIHLRVYLPPGQNEPLKMLGRFVYNVKAWIRNLAKRELGILLSWNKNYHDWICLSREVINAVDKYIENNPLKWSLMHGRPPPLKVIEPLESPLLNQAEWWTAAGNIALLGKKIASIRLSRKIPAALFPEVATRLAGACEKGYALAGTWISPCERYVFDSLRAKGGEAALFIRASQDPLEMVYRPKHDEPALFAEGRFLVISRVAASGTGRGVAWHGINDALGEIAHASGGVSLYVKYECGRMVWDFS